MKHSSITRRRMLVNGARALAGLTLAASCRPFAETRKETPHGFKLAVCDWTIGKTADPASLEMAKRIGLDGVQVDFGRGDDDLYGKGSIDFERVRKPIDDIGHRGWIVMEGTKMPLGVEESCRYDAEYLRGIFPPKV